MGTQLELFPDDVGGKPVDVDKVDKARSRAAEAEYFKDQRVKASPLVAEAELAKMREMLSKPRGGGGGGGSIGGMPKMNRDITKNYKKGGTVKSASARADGCCIKGKTRA